MNQKVFNEVFVTSKLTTKNLQFSKSLLTGVSVFNPNNGDTINIGDSGVVISPLGPLSGTLEVAFPESPQDGQVVHISFTQDVGNVYFTGGRFAAKSALSGKVLGGTTLTLFYHGGTNKWYKLSGSNCNCSSVVPVAPVVPPKKEPLMPGDPSE